jgi:hypothetical protein
MCTTESVGTQVIRGRSWNEPTARGLLALYLRLLPLSPEFVPSRTKKRKESSSASKASTSKPPTAVKAFGTTSAPVPASVYSKPPFPFFGATTASASASNYSSADAVASTAPAFSFGTTTDSALIQDRASNSGPAAASADDVCQFGFAAPVPAGGFNFGSTSGSTGDAFKFGTSESLATIEDEEDSDSSQVSGKRRRYA